MKTSIAVLALFTCALSLPAADKKKAAAPAPQALSIPKDAAQNPDGTYSWTDKTGKKWLYAKTPFGVMRSAAEGAPSASATPDAASASTVQFTKVTDAGDSVKFERATPFGAIKWEKKKTELTDEEKSIVAQKAGKSQ